MTWTEFTFKWGNHVWAPLQVPSELDELMHLFVSLKPKTIMEIGCWAGGTMGYWLNHSPENSTVIGVDVTTEFMPKGMLTHPKLSMVVGSSVEPTTVEKVKRILNGRSIDFLFIDGWHENRIPIHDFDIYSPLVTRPGGIVAMHDVISSTLPVKDYWKELQARGLKTHTITDGTPESMGIGVVLL